MVTKIELFETINTTWKMNTGPVACPDMSVTKCQTTQRKLKKKKKEKKKGNAYLIYTVV